MVARCSGEGGDGRDVGAATEGSSRHSEVMGLREVLHHQHLLFSPSLVLAPCPPGPASGTTGSLPFPGSAALWEGAAHFLLCGLQGRR